MISDDLVLRLESNCDSSEVVLAKLSESRSKMVESSEMLPKRSKIFTRPPVVLPSRRLVRVAAAMILESP